MKLKSDAKCVLDASALMALINNEPGALLVEQYIEKACISSVNFAETLTKMLEQGIPLEEAENVLDNLNLEIVPFDRKQVSGTSLLRSSTKPYGLSLADRICLNLGKMLKLPVLTTDQAWIKIKDPALKPMLAR